MRRTNLDREWIFMEGEPSSIPGMQRKTRTVNLPHDFMIESDVSADSVNGRNTGYYTGATGTYTKYLDIPETWQGQQVMVEFDGAFRDTTVILNGHVMGRHHYGYTPFCVDLSSRLNYGNKNRLAVVVSNDAEPNSRWYPGGGLYRHVNLLTAPGNLYIVPDGIFLHTSHIVDRDAFVIVEIEVQNSGRQDQDAWAEILILEKNTGYEAARGKIKIHVPGGSRATARTRICVEQAQIWDIDAPNLYEVKVNLSDLDQVLDEAETAFGIRTVSVDSKNGFMLNGRRLKLKGGCIHHDNGILGAASFYDSEYRKVLIHKKNGYNALRFAHNPMSSDLLRACDEIGILVYDEAFDMWNMSKNLHDFSRHFEKEWEEELTNFIKRDRNHPSVIIWSVGNELPEQGGLSNGYQTCARLVNKVRSLDSTRPVSGALCSFFNGLDDEDTAKFWASLMEEMRQGGSVSNLDGQYGRKIWNDYTEAFAAPWDVVGYNYLNYHYEEAGKMFPDRVICATESKPGQMEEYWSDVEKYPYLIGDFLWTSHDYIGEAGIGKTLYVEEKELPSATQKLYYAWYPWRTAGAGDFDLCGFERPQSAFHRIVWGSDETYIACYDPAKFDKIELLGRYGWPECEHSWTWEAEQGSRVKVEVYSGAETVELFVNGKSVGTEAVQHKKAVFILDYEPGILEAVSYTDGKEISRDYLKTAGKPTRLKITSDENMISGESLTADGQSLYFAVVEVTDEEGLRVPYAEYPVTAKVTGEATLAAFGTGRPVTEENYTCGQMVSWQGRLLAVIRSGFEDGEAQLIVSADGLQGAELTLKIENTIVEDSE